MGKDQPAANGRAKTGVMICGHGSRDDRAVAEFNTLATHIRARLPDYEVESGFLEFARPVLGEGLEKLKARGATRILCLPGMLFAAGHVKNDLPSEVNEFAHANPDLDVRYGRELAIDARLLRAAAERIKDAEKTGKADVGRADTLLMVVGRGTRDSDANSNVAKVTRMLWEGLGVGWAETCYSGVTTPLVDDGLAHAARLGYKRIIVFPYFLFTGVLVRRIYDGVDAAAQRFPDIEFLKASYLNDHPLLVDTFVDRVGEMLSGENVMNCQLCKYREQIIGFEGDRGQAQVGHHHHVRGIGTDGASHHHHHRHHDGGHDDGKTG